MKIKNIISISCIAVGVALAFFTWWALVLIILPLIISAIYIIPQGYYAYASAMGYIIGSPRQHGIGWKIPFVSKVTYASAEVYSYSEALQVETNTGDKIAVTYAVSFRFKKEYIHLIKEEIPSLEHADFLNHKLRKKIRQALLDVYGLKTKEEARTQRTIIAREALRIIPTEHHIEDLNLYIE